MIIPENKNKHQKKSTIIPVYVVALISTFLCDKEFSKLARSCKEWHKELWNNDYLMDNRIFCVKKFYVIKHVLSKQGVRKLEICKGANVTSDNIHYLNGLKYLRFDCNCDSIYDDDIYHLKGIDTLIFQSCEHLTDAMFCYLQGIRKLQIRPNLKIRNKGFKYLKGIKKLNIRACCNVTEEIFEHLKGIKELHMGDNKDVTGKNLFYLKGIEILDISNQRKLKDKYLKSLSGIKKIRMQCCPGITGECFKYLSSLKILHAHECDNIEVDNFKYLINLEELYVDYNQLNANEILGLIPNLKKLWVTDLFNLQHVNILKNIKDPKDLSREGIPLKFCDSY